jgi:hypothetical protein
MMLVLVSSCQPQPQQQKHRRPTSRPTTQDVDAAQDNPFLPIIQPQKLSIWQIAVPYGSISTNESFWKYIDENTLDISTYDMLYKNGLRAGLASARDWEALRKSLSLFHATSQQRQFTGADAQTTELPMRLGVVSQSLFYFDKQGHLAGRTFDTCDNFLAVSFEPSPAHPRNATRIVIHPLVRSQRTELQYTKLNNATQFQYVRPQHLYELSLKTDIPKDHFFVLAPSPEARNQTSLGHAFLTRDDQPEQTETVLLILPTGFEMPKPKL